MKCDQSEHLAVEDSGALAEVPGLEPGLAQHATRRNVHLALRERWSRSRQGVCMSVRISDVDVLGSGL